MLGSLKKRIPIRVTVVFVFVFGTLVTAATAITLQYLFSSKIATDAVTSYATSFAKNTQENIIGLSQKASHSVELLAHNSTLVSDGVILEEVTDRLFTNLLTSSNEFYAVYIGLENGDFYELINLEASPAIRRALGASLTDRFAKVIIRGEGAARTKQTIFLDEALNVSRETEEFTEYDASVRPWFQLAGRVKSTQSEPYLFQHLQSPGQTFSMKIDGTQSVVAVDIALSTLSGFLSNQVNQDKAIGDSEVYLYDSDGNLTASNQSGEWDKERNVLPLSLTEEEMAYIQALPPLRVSNETDWAPLDYSIAGQPRGYIVEKTRMLAQSLGLEIEYVNGVTWGELVDYFRQGDIEILTPVYRTETNKDWGLYSDPIVDMKMALATRPGEPAHSHIRELRGKTIAIPSGWSIIPEIRNSYPDITILKTESLSDALKSVQSGEADAALETAVTLEYNLDIYYLSDLKITRNINIEPVKFDSNLRFVFHPEDKQLKDLFNRALENFSSEDRAYLEDKWLNNMQQLMQSHSSTVPYNELITLAGQPYSHTILQSRTIDGVDRLIFVSKLSDVKDRYFAIVLNADHVLAESRKDVMISTGITAVIVMLLLPFCWILANPIVRPIRQLAVENDKIKHRKYKEVQRQVSMIKEIDDLSISMVEMSEAIAEHAAQQQHLMDSFVELIAQAIDDKSPYTGGHCHRVPELGLMLADIASENKTPYFDSFSIDGEDKRREFKLAAWLHDCGKITTPEHVVDKGSKLETNYNRIHEIRTRFEVVWRDLQIEFYQKLEKNPADREMLEAHLRQEQEKLVDDFMFVAKSNVGGEAMQDESIERLQKIAARTWTRNFDDRAGLSPLEERRIKNPSVPVPADEFLLTDRPEHKIDWERMPEYDPKFEITLQPPALQNNQGELYNLSIRRGTLNSEERYRINEHTVSTIKILESLPFPPELANVPRYASTHHETLKGTGYPRSLTEKDLSIGERILVLADIFEALTADDRPYKKAKPLSVALRIMRNMVKDDHIDKDVFNLFLTSNIYWEYSKQYLSRNQLEEIDIGEYLV